LKHLGYTVSDQRVGNILKRHGIPPAPERIKTITWREFTRSHLAILSATDFFHRGVWSGFGLIVLCLLRFLHSSCHAIQSVRGARYQPMPALGALGGQVFNLLGHGLRWVSLLEQRSQARRAGHRVLTGQIGSESKCEVADAPPRRSQELTKVVDLSSAFRRPIRDGPASCRPSLVLIKHDCEAA
jgi:hypothetical protein